MKMAAWLGTGLDPVAHLLALQSEAAAPNTHLGLVAWPSGCLLVCRLGEQLQSYQQQLCTGSRLSRGLWTRHGRLGPGLQASLML